MSDGDDIKIKSAVSVGATSAQVVDDENDLIKLFSKQVVTPKTEINVAVQVKSTNVFLENKKYYDMTHKQRGMCLIYNHMEFKSLPTRRGTNVDRDAAAKVFKDLGFNVLCYNDLTRNEVMMSLEKVSQMDHSDYDCLVVIVMSHGEKGIIYAKDREYPVDNLWELFLGDNCETLVGKPKLFFIQACRGDELDKGITALKRMTGVGDEVDAIPAVQKPLLFLIPTMADLLAMYSTYEGYYAWRNPDNGSWFIQALCSELKENGKTEDIFSLLTGVSRRVAYEYKSNVPNDKNMDSMKQMPCIVSMLTKLLYFTKKCDKTD